MVISLLLALAGTAHFAAMTPVSGYQEWEEYPAIQKFPGFHPFLRFNQQSTFIFTTTAFIAEGKYQKQGDHYDFHPLMAFEIENADVDKLASDMDPETGRKFRIAYFHSMGNFDADYNESDGSLKLNYTVDGIPKAFDLHALSEGDDQLPMMAADYERGLVGVWHSPEPFPEKLDAKTRYRIGGVEGLQQFFKEAQASDGAQFGLIDIRPDKTFRRHAAVGTWYRDGSLLKLRVDGTEIALSISPTGAKLQAGGKTVYTRD